MMVSDGSPPLKPSQPVVAHVSRCRTRVCWQRVRRRRRIRFLWRTYKAHPMPYCTWGPESSVDPLTGRTFFGNPWHPLRYRVKNPHSTAGGKFQVLNTTWFANSKWRPHFSTAYPAAAAPALEQERTARVILSRGGLSQWVGC